MHCHAQSGYWSWTCQSIKKHSTTTNIYTNPLYLQEYISDLSIMLWSEYYSQSLD
uniref:ORF54a n=1 Tax=Pinus koraiensis TaxID=88728 RepID=Q85X58_PINKO|nr:ORF54a [Pinus koraiensis]